MLIQNLTGATAVERTFNLLVLLLAISGCKQTAADKNAIADYSAGAETTHTANYTFNLYTSDSTKVDIEPDVIRLTIGKFQQEYDLKQLHIPVKTPEIEWTNSEYICVVTWWLQAQSRHVFLPVQPANKLIYLDKDIEAMDSVHNNIVYIDTIYNKAGKAVFKVENLLSRKSWRLDLSINEQNAIYPYYKKISLTENQLTISTSIETKRIVF